MSKKLSEITEEATSVNATDRFYIEQGGVSKYIDGASMASEYSGGGQLSYQTEITANTTLDGTQKGLNKVYPVNNASARTITITTGDYVENDVINIERRGQGTVEIIADTGVRIRGVRDIDNRYFINDVNSIVALLCRGGEEFAIIGNLTRGYTGAVTTSDYTSLFPGDVNKDITVIGSGFSDNMLVSCTANATLNSFTVVSPTQLTLNMTAVGGDGDTITITYDNGDVYVDTDAMTITDDYVTDLVANWRFDNNYDDSQGSHDLTDAGDSTFATGVINQCVELGGTTSQLLAADSDDFSFINGGSDDAFSISFWVKFDTIASRNPLLIAKRYSGSNYEWTVQYLEGSDTLSITIWSAGGSSNYIRSLNSSAGFTTGTWYNICVTYDGSETPSGLITYIDGSSAGTSSETGTYAGMTNGTAPVSLGSQSWTTASTTNRLIGDLDLVKIWNGRELSAAEALDVYTKENAGTPVT